MMSLSSQGDRRGYGLYGKHGDKQAQLRQKVHKKRSGASGEKGRQDYAAMPLPFLAGFSPKTQKLRSFHREFLMRSGAA
jgi:hypothetical protein